MSDSFILMNKLGVLMCLLVRSGDAKLFGDKLMLLVIEF